MIFRNLLYIYQLEHYDKKRFLAFAYTHNWFAIGRRSRLDWTKRVGLIFAVCTAIVILPAIITSFLVGFWGVVLSIAVCTLLLPIVMVVADIIISPLVMLRKKNKIILARQVILEAKKRNLTTIGITGSFGKTTVKHLTEKVLGEKYTVATFPGNINTDIGVANHILKHKHEIANADIVIAEMGAHKKGDIKKLCFIIEPDYSLTTAIGEAHVERFGSLENIISAKFELANKTQRKAFVNSGDSTIQQNVDTTVAGDVDVVKVSAEKEMGELKVLKDFKGITFIYQDEKFTTNLIAAYVVEFCALVFALAKELKMTTKEMKEGLKNVEPIPHRLQVIRNEDENRVIIDDSYNGNYAGFLAGLEVLGRAKGRKVVVTPGIVELGEERSKEVHTALAKRYAKEVDLLLLIKNKNVQHIMRTLRKVGYNAFKVYETAEEAHKDLGNVLKDGDTILFQNDITDNYA